MSRLARNILFNIIGQGLVLLLGFVAVKYIFSLLGDDALGIIYFSALINSILMGVLEKGVYSTAVREISINAKSDVVYTREFIRTGTLLTWGAVLIFGVIIYILAPLFVEHWIKVVIVSESDAINSLRILGISSLSAFPLSFYASILRGLQRMEYNNIIDVATTALQQLGVVVVILVSGNFLWVVLWLATSYMIKIITYLFVCVRFFPVTNFVPGFSANVIKRVSGFSLKMIYISVLSMLHKQTDKVVLSKIETIGVLGYYGFVYNAISKAGLLTLAISNAAYPSFCDLSTREDQSDLLGQFRKLVELVLYVTVPIFALIIYIAPPLFTFVFNEMVSQQLFVPVILLCIGFYLNGTLSVPYRLILATGKPEIAVRQNILALIFVLPITVLLVYRYGIVGAATGWVLYFVFGYVYILPKIYRKCLQCSSIEFFQMFVRVTMIAIISYFAVFYYIYLEYRLDIFELLVAYIIATAIFLIVAYLSISELLRLTINRYASSILRLK